MSLANTQEDLQGALTEKEAAKMLTVTPKTLQSWRWAKRGPKYVKLGRRIAYRLSDLNAFLEAHIVETAN